MSKFRKAAREAAEAEALGRERYFPVAGAAAVVLGVGGLVAVAIAAAASGDDVALQRALWLILLLAVGLVSVTLILLAGLWLWIFGAGFVRYRELLRTHRDSIVITARDFYLDPDGPLSGRLYDFFTFDRGITIGVSGLTFWGGGWAPESMLVVPRGRIVGLHLETRTGGIGPRAAKPREAFVLTLAEPDEWLVFRVADGRLFNVRPLDRTRRIRVLADILEVLKLDHLPGRG